MVTRQPADDPVLELSGDIDGLPEDFSRELDQYLNETLVAEPHPPHRTRKPRKALRR